jgi:hypothetical protein
MVFVASRLLKFSCIVIFSIFTNVMMKRSIAICLFALASTIWLAHAIIPHHHHIAVGKVAEAIVYHHHDHEPESPANHSHENEGSKARNFVLDQVVILRSGAFRDAPLLTSGPAHDSDFSQPFIACLTYIHQAIIPESTLFRRTDYQKPFTLFLSRDNQLRGPPVA